MTWKQLTERDCREWKLSAINPHDRRIWRSGVRSAMHAASQQSGRGPLMWMLPLYLHVNKKSDYDMIRYLYVPLIYSKPCVRQPPLKLTLVVDVKRWLSYKGTCHVILLAKLHDMYLYKTDNFFHINPYLKSVSNVALLHRFYCRLYGLDQGSRN